MNPRRARQARARIRLEQDANVVLCRHSLERATELGFAIDEVLTCVARPQQTYSCHPYYGADRRMYQRGQMSVVVHESSRTVITVLLKTPARWAHGLHTRTASS